MPISYLNSNPFEPSTGLDISTLGYLPSDIIDGDECIIIRAGIAYKNTFGNVKAYTNTLTQSTPGVFAFATSGDDNGLFYHLGIQAGNGTWVNPHTANVIFISMSSVWSGVHGDTSVLVNRAIDANISTADIANSWYKVDLLDNRLRCNYYSIRGRNFEASNPRQWTLQGSNDDATWNDLHIVNDIPLTQNQWLSSPVSDTTLYRYFRLLQTGLNTSGDNLFCVGEWELYGELG